MTAMLTMTMLATAAATMVSAILAAPARARRRLAFRFYSWQLQAWRARAQIIGVIAPRGEGKTWFGARWFLLKGLQSPGSINLAIASGYTALQDTMLPEFLRSVEELGVNYTHRVQERRILIHLRRGTVEFRFRTVENHRSVDKLRGAEYGIVWMDEARNCPRYAYVIALSCMRCQHTAFHQLLITTTPNGFDWLYDEFVERPDPAKLMIHVQERGNYRLPDGYDRLLRSQMDATLAAQELGAEFLSIGKGRVYHEFLRTANVRPLEYHPDLPLLLLVDYGAVSTIVVAQVVGPEIHCLREYHVAGLYELARDVVKDFRTHAAGVELYDDASGIGRMATGKTPRSVLLEALRGWGGGVQSMRGKSNPDVTDRAVVVNRQLCDGNGVRHLFVSPRCRNLIRDFEQVVWKEDNRHLDKTGDYQKLTHWSDPVGYYVWETRRPDSFHRRQDLMEALHR